MNKSNKKIGSNFEKDFLYVLFNKGYWCTFLTPSANGSQPFDIIAVKSNLAMAFDCKTCNTSKFNFSRIEQNQLQAYEMWKSKNNYHFYLAIKYNHKIYLVSMADIYDDILSDDIRSFDIEKKGKIIYEYHRQ